MDVSADHATGIVSADLLSQRQMTLTFGCTGIVVGAITIGFGVLGDMLSRHEGDEEEEDAEVATP